ncbi:hypothetical protein FRX31_024490 [Thalictrum thalictroides]|uniref:DUF4283 domain-containing protein n=1 Tax=Thalictrum thalictroides TaxID=46969 RepID=A0A7J6VLW7_THATH|nr:hypothetical protein FRX31_024490 [Thalictrum thalictroides]
MDYRARANRGYGKCVEIIEGKMIEVESWKTSRSWDKVHLTEKFGKMVFTGKTSMEGGRWIGKLLCQVSCGMTVMGSVFRYVDDYLSMIGTVRGNRSGTFLQLQLFTKMANNKRMMVCIPAGEDRMGWTNLGGKIRNMLMCEEVHPQRMPSRPVFQTMTQQNQLQRPSFAEALGKGDQRRDFNPTQVLEMNNSWWSAVAVCQPSNPNPNWEWVKDRCTGVFAGAGLKIIEGGKALIFLNSEEDLAKLLNLPPLTYWEGTFTFSKWSPSAGALKVCSGLRSDVEVVFTGIPYHLRVKAVIESLSKKCGNSVGTIKGEAEYTSPYCFVGLKNCEIQKIPRSITLEHKGANYLIWVEIISEEVKSLAKRPTCRSTTEGFLLTEQRREIVTADVAKYDPWVGAAKGPTISARSPPGFGRNCCSVQNSNCQPRQMFQEGFQANDIVPHVNTNSGESGIQPSSRYVSPNRFAHLEVESYDPEENEEIFNTHGSHFGHVVQVHGSPQICADQPDPAPLQPIFEPISGHRPRSRSRRGLGLSNFPVVRLNKHVIRYTQALRNGRARSRDSRSKGREILTRREAECSTHNNDNVNQRVNEEESVVKEASNIELDQICVQESTQLHPLNEVNGFRTRDQIRVIAESLHNCRNNDDLSNWIKWLVIPAGEKLGITTTTSRRGQEKLYTELASIDFQKEDVDEQNQEELPPVPGETIGN